MEEQIEKLISQMTLEEKISLLAGADMWHTVPVERLGIPVMKVTDGPMGARGANDPAGPTSACFPCGTALASTWNVELVECVGQALGEETRSKGAHMLLAPTVNIHRSPLAGRNFECYSEDPYLTSRLAVAYIRGLQREGVGACIKHFVCNDSEFERQSISSVVGERALREIYLRPFQVALREAQPWSVMSSYNRVNGVYANENARLLLEILKGEWGFDGLVMSDWYGTYTPNAVKGGLDLEMPGPARWMGKYAFESVQKGEIGEDAIDDKIRRLLRTMERVGVFESPKLRDEQAIDRPEHRRIAREAASEAIVLLKNSNSILPLDKNKVKSVAVIGANARWASIMGGGSVHVTPHYVVTPLDAIKDRLGESRVSYAIGCAVHRHLPEFEKAWLVSDKRLKLEYFDNTALSGSPIRTDTTTKMELEWHGDKLAYVDPSSFSVRLTGAFVPPTSGKFTIGIEAAGKSRLLIDDTLLVDLWDVSGDDSPHRIASSIDIDLVAGRTYQLRAEYAPGPGLRWRSVRLGCMPALPAHPIEQAAALAAKSDVAIVFAGLTKEWESEGFDRPDMELPGEQAQLIEAVCAANKRTIVVLNTGAPVTIEWLDRAPAVLQAWYLGQETGNAIADVLFGDVNPSGRLPTTWPRRLQDNPAYINYPGENGEVVYGEGIFVGYRYYDRKDVAPRFPFGYGLSYTTFQYSNLQANDEYVLGEEIRVAVDVENVGSRAGQEVIQLYVRDCESRLVRPEKELKAFAKIALEPGQKRTVTFSLDDESLSYYDTAQKRWVAEPGEFEVLVGSSSRDIRLAGRFQVKPPATSGSGQRLNTGMPLRTIMQDAAGKMVLAKYLGAYMEMAQTDMVQALSLEQIAAFVPEVLTPELLKSINDDLANL